MVGEDAVRWTKVRPQYSLTLNKQYEAVRGPTSAGVGGAAWRTRTPLDGPRFTRSIA